MNITRNAKSRLDTSESDRRFATQSAAPIARQPFPEQIEPQGRALSIEECNFVFDKVWTKACTHDHHEDEEIDHVHGEKQTEILISDWIKIIHYSG